MKKTLMTEFFLIFPMPKLTPRVTRHMFGRPLHGDVEN